MRCSRGRPTQLDILVYAGAFLIETLDLADVLAWKASKGTRIRVLVGDPRSTAVGMRAAELSLDWLPQRCQSTLDYLRRVDGIGLRPHGASHYASLFRFDDLLLANTHAYGIWACHSPVLQLHKAQAQASSSTSTPPPSTPPGAAGGPAPSQPTES